MSEAVLPDGGPSAGALLRQAREDAGLHVATLAANLKVPVRKIEALEEDRYDLLGDAVFVRALASSICRTLKVDAQPVLQRLPQTASPRLVQEGEGINAPFRAPSDGPSPGVLDQVSKPVVITVLALLLAALVVVLLPMGQRSGEIAAPANAPEAPSQVALVPSTPVAETGPAPVAPAAVPPPPSAPVATAPMAAPAPAAAVPAAAPVAAVPATAASAMPAASAALAAASGPINARGTVLFRTRAQSWIQVTDATGATVFQRLMEPGESAGASGTTPLSVVIGSVEATEVQVRGRPFNLAPVSKDNVARFEVK